MGKWSYGNPTVVEWGDNTKAVIGKYCSIAPEVTIFLGGNHHTRWVTTFPFPAFWQMENRCPQKTSYSNGNVTVGNDVWIASGVLILSGITIGDGAVIAARAVVTKDVPPYAIVGGNPAKIIRYRFTKKQIKALLAIAWWDWPESEIVDAMPFLLNEDINAFIDHAMRKKAFDLIK
jgi:acetyltransferase-like isoleucine patch superfamily enzyme